MTASTHDLSLQTNSSLGTQSRAAEITQQHFNVLSRELLAERKAKVTTVQLQHWRGAYHLFYAR